MLYWRKCFKYFNGYINHSNCDIKPFFIKLSKLNGSIKSSEKVNYMLFMLNENQ